MCAVCVVCCVCCDVVWCGVLTRVHDVVCCVCCVRSVRPVTTRGLERARAFWEQSLLHVIDRDARHFMFVGQDEYSGGMCVW